MQTVNRRRFLLLTCAGLEGGAIAGCGGGGDNSDEATARVLSDGPANPPIPAQPPAQTPAQPSVPAPTPAPAPAPAQSSVSLTLVGPASGLERSVSRLFTVSHTGTLTGTVVITPSDDAGGQFWPLDVGDGNGKVRLSPTRRSSSFYYAPGSSGAKSITLSNDAGAPNPSTHAYSAMAAVPASVTPFRLVRDGATIGRYATLQACKDSGGWRSGDVVKCTGGNYVVFNPTDPGCTLLVNNSGGVQSGVNVNALTIEWETPGVPMVLDYSRYCAVGMWSGGQPQLLTMGIACHDLTVRGLHFRGHRVPLGASWLGAGIWTLTDYPNATGAAATLTVEYCKFQHLPDGIKTRTHYNFSTYVRYCVFEDNSDAKGLDHDIYTGSNALTYVLGCTFRKTPGQGYPQAGMGHAIKSRCRATTVLGNMIDVEMFSDGTGGCSQNINTPNGGVVVIAGNVINHYGSLSNNEDGNCLRYGDDQHTRTVDTSTDPSLTTHSLLLAQNTLRKYNGRRADGSDKPIISIYPTGTATTLLNGAGVQVAVTAVIRNNLVATDTARAAAFVSIYPDNTAASVSTLSNGGEYTGAQIAGTPAVNDAPFDWAGDFAIPVSRRDTHRGGRTAYIPSWVPTTAWMWTDIPGTIWSDYIRNDGTGLAPAVTSLDPGPSRNYEATWEYSGPTYSPKNHEMWMFGGGHAGSTINILTRWNLHKELPDVTMVSAPTPEAERRAWVFNTQKLLSTAYFPSDGKPYSPHSYFNNIYVDSRDEFISFGVAGIATSSDGSNMSAGTASFRDIAGHPRNSAWRAAKHYADIPVYPDGSYEYYGPRALSRDGSAIYYWPVGQGLKKFTFATNAHTSVSNSGAALSAQLAINGDSTQTLHISGSSDGGWAVQTCNLATGARTSVSVTGYAIPTGLQCYGVEWIETLGKYVAMWITAGAYNNQSIRTDPNISTVVVATLELTSPSTAIATEVRMTGSAPTKCNSLRGMSYDPAYGCLIFAMSHSKLLKAVKVA